MANVKSPTYANEMEKIYGLYYIQSNYDRDQISEIKYNPKEKGIGDSDFIIKFTNWNIEKIQIKTRPDTKDPWSINQEEFIKGIWQLFSLFQFEKNDDLIKEIHYTLILEGGTVGTDHGKKLHSLREQKRDKTNITFINKAIFKDIYQFYKDNKKKKQIKSKYSASAGGGFALGPI